MDEVVLLSVLSAALNSHRGTSHSPLRECMFTILAQEQVATARLTKDEKLKNQNARRIDAAQSEKIVLCCVFCFFRPEVIAERSCRE